MYFQHIQENYVFWLVQDELFFKMEQSFDSNREKKKNDWIYSLSGKMCKNTKYWIQWFQPVLRMTEPGSSADNFANKLFSLNGDSIEGFCKRWQHLDWLDNNTTWKDIPFHEAYEKHAHWKKIIMFDSFLFPIDIFLFALCSACVNIMCVCLLCWCHPKN